MADADGCDEAPRTPAAGEEKLVSPTTPSPPLSPVEEQAWRGCSMAEIHRYLNEFELEHVPEVRPSDTHTVLHHYPIRASDSAPPRPLKSHHKWDALHVRLPCSAKSQYPVTAADGSSTIESRWEMIEQALLRPITNSHELQAAILAYNTKYETQWNFRALHRLFETELDESEARVFFEDLLPRIIRLALRLPELVQAPIPLLKQGKTHSLTLTQQQISCLLANAFLCTFPRRNTLKRKSEYSTFPDINFNRLFQSSGQSVLEKIKCICHYFRRVCPTERDSSNVPTGCVTFTRRSLHHDDMPNWAESVAPLGVTPLHITADGTIEDQGLGLLQVDFANKYLGGGVLGSGCVQEEIRFVICPELIISKLFTECLRPTETLLMVGCERYSNYSGYADSFQWAGNHEDATPRDKSRRRLTHIVAIDALAFTQSSHQYYQELMLRELNKAYVGFLHTLDTPAPGVASGNWGCGAFGGDARLKALLQLMVCTVTKRPLVYYTFGNAQLRDEVHRMHTFFIEENVRVKDLWASLRKFHAQRLDAKKLYNFIYSCHGKGVEHSPNSKMAQKKSPTLKSTTTTMTTTTSNTATTNPAGSSKLSSLPTCSTAASRASINVDKNKKNPTSISAQKPINVSQDIFVAETSESETDLDAAIAISSSSSHSSAAAAPATALSNSQASSTRICISDDSQTDALLLATVAAVEAVATSPKMSKWPAKATTPKTQLDKSQQTPSKQSGLRQRTLLEMLDQCYTEEGSCNSSQQPASKRHCLGNADAKH